MADIITKIFTLNLPDTTGMIAIAGATASAFVLLALWYGTFFSKSWMEQMMVYRNIKEKKFEDSFDKRWPYPMAVSFASSFLCHLVRSYFMWHWFAALGVATMKEGVAFALCWFIGAELSAAHHCVWSGKTITHIAIDQASELSTFVVIAVVLVLLA
eukprot:m.47836 g.47836  ORF g.47836 m.47836 type:complete len:157 (-) comp10536_c0_seq2:102-572(-)